MVNRRNFIQVVVGTLGVAVCPIKGDLPVPAPPHLQWGPELKHDLTDIYMSPEALEDIRNWGVDQIDEATRKEILLGY